ncbi:27555_t:CDS:2, partial [Gigaspora margarita]
MVKYTRDRLLKNQIVVYISNCGLYATCKCRKVIKLKHAYDKTYFNNHINGDGCKFQDGVISILNFFSPILKEDNQSNMKQYPCTGLDKLFSEKFPSNKAVKYKELSKKELQILDNEIIQHNPIAKYIYNQDIGDLLYLANNTSSNANNKNSFWTKFAEMGKAGSFKNKKIFEELCHVMVQIADREQHKKELQNLKYSDQFSDFLVILASFSPRAYNIFQQNLAGHTIQNI